MYHCLESGNISARLRMGSGIVSCFKFTQVDFVLSTMTSSPKL